MVNQYRFETKLMAASVNYHSHARKAILSGASVITIIFDVLKRIFYHSATDAGISDFLNAAKNN